MAAPQTSIIRPSGHCHHLAHGRSRRLYDLRRLFTIIAVKRLRNSKTLRDKSALAAGGQVAGVAITLFTTEPIMALAFFAPGVAVTAFVVDDTAINPN